MQHNDPHQPTSFNSSVPVVFVVDDDLSVQKALSRLLRSKGFETKCFSSPVEFLQNHDSSIPGCAVLDVSMPGLNGLELQEQLLLTGCQRSIIFLTGHGDIPSSVRAMKGGAVDFLTKPVSGSDLLKAVNKAIEQDSITRNERKQWEVINQRLAKLTPREFEVMEHVVSGELNKQIAAELGLVEKTIKVHRAHVMEKMEVQSLAELARIAERLQIGPKINI